jgi:hypothetical protein
MRGAVSVEGERSLMRGRCGIENFVVSLMGERYETWKNVGVSLMKGRCGPWKNFKARTLRAVWSDLDSTDFVRLSMWQHCSSFEINIS